MREEYAWLIDMLHNEPRIAVEVESENDELKEAKNNLKSTDDALSRFKMMLAGLTRDALFNHMFQYYREYMGDTNPSDYLGTEVRKTQKINITPSDMNLTYSKIITYTVGPRAYLKLEKRKLGNLIFIKTHSGIQNDGKELKMIQSN